MKDPKILYQRPLPGGGFVNVEEKGDPDGPRAHIAVERRSDPTRRSGHAPPIIAVAEGASVQNALRQLFEIAADNVAIARALLRWRSDGKARF